ncbi:hypothetical protein V6N13_122683 [Hibiscus sabdariffa]
MALTHDIPLRRPNSDAGEDSDTERDVESGENEGESTKSMKVYKEKFLVIMAGEEKPTFLATSVCIKVCSFGDKNGKLKDREGSEKPESAEKVKEEMSGDDDERLPSPTITNNFENHEKYGSQPTLDQI